MPPSFLATLRARRISGGPITVLTFGATLWLATTALYAAATARVFDAPHPQSVRALWVVVLAAHAMCSLLVVADAVAFAGRFWPVQTLVIGTGSFATLALPALLAHALMDEDVQYLILTLLSLLFACLANATMLAVVFELFHAAAAPLPLPTVTRATAAAPRRRRE